MPKAWPSAPLKFCEAGDWDRGSGHQVAAGPSEGFTFQKRNLCLALCSFLILTDAVDGPPGLPLPSPTLSIPSNVLRGTDALFRGLHSTPQPHTVLHTTSSHYPLASILPSGPFPTLSLGGPTPPRTFPSGAPCLPVPCHWGSV